VTVVEPALVLLLVAGIALFVSRPLRDGRPAAAGPASALAALEAQRDAKLAEIRDAELDLAAGKLTPEDHRELDLELRAEAASLLRRLEEARAA
jgi:hypothetical protein